MCLAVLPTYQIETVSEPLIVYKVCTRLIQNNRVHSSIQGYEYPAGQLQICQNPFNLAESWYHCRFVDSIDKFKTKALFGENLKGSWVSGKFYMITTGFHFYFNIERILNFHIDPEDIIAPFQIPVGARIIRGIDNELGVTNQIMRL